MTLYEVNYWSIAHGFFLLMVLVLLDHTKMSLFKVNVEYFGLANRLRLEPAGFVETVREGRLLSVRCPDATTEV